MSTTIDLIWLDSGSPPPDWPLGSIHVSEARPRQLYGVVARALSGTSGSGVLFWDGQFGRPDPARVTEAFARPGDVWHAGLKLGQGGKPELMDAVTSTWMLSRDPDPGIEATSWRLSLRACLARKDVLLQMGQLIPEFHTLESASLEMGHRFASRGVIVRHIPLLLPDHATVTALPSSLSDDVRFLLYRFGPFWTRWAIVRAVMAGEINVRQAWECFRLVKTTARPSQPTPYANGAKAVAPGEWVDAKVTVLIPTVDRYPYLRTLLGQLERQTVEPHEIIIVDQTTARRRDTSLPEDFSHLPLKVIYQDEPGQCTSRNAGLASAQGDYVLFLDDDDEVQHDLIERHLQNLAEHQAEVSCGVADEIGAGPLPVEFTYKRLSDVFPTNNSLIRRSVLQGSGLFDLAYNRGQRADGDLGMRIYLSGALMILNPSIVVLHHHAPSGGLRTHKARVITYASSRKKLSHRQIVSTTEIYLAHRYFTPRQTREMLWLGIAGTFSARGSRWRKVAKVIIAVAFLPNTIWRTRSRCLQAVAMLRDFPQIPKLEDSPVPETA